MKQIIIIIILIVFSLLSGCKSIENDITGIWKLNITFSNEWTGEHKLNIIRLYITGDQEQGEFRNDKVFDGNYTLANGFLFMRTYGNQNITLRGYFTDNNYITGESEAGPINKGTFEMWRIK